MGNALDRARAAQAETEALKVSAQETTAALQETTAELQNLKGELKWLQLHTKREHELARDPKRFRRELIVCGGRGRRRDPHHARDHARSGHYHPRDGHRDVRHHPRLSTQASTEN